MKKTFILIVLALIIVAVYWLTRGSGAIPNDKQAAIKQYVNTILVDTLEQDYQRHKITITVLVADLTIDKIAKQETRGSISYTAYGKVSYRIQGKREWHDTEGNLIRLDPESKIAHWFSCEILEDRYGELYTDKYRIPLTLYADKPLP
jgi:hypothetical protein